MANTDRSKRVISKPARFVTTSSDEVPKRKKTATASDADIEDDIEDIRTNLQDNADHENHTLLNNNNNNLTSLHNISTSQYTNEPYTSIPLHTHTYMQPYTSTQSHTQPYNHTQSYTSYAHIGNDHIYNNVYNTEFQENSRACSNIRPSPERNRQEETSQFTHSHWQKEIPQSDKTDNR